MELLIISWIIFGVFYIAILHFQGTLSIYNPVILLFIIVLIFGVGKIVYLYYFASPYYLKLNLVDGSFEKLNYATLVSYLFMFSVVAGSSFFTAPSYHTQTLSKRDIHYSGDNKLGVLTIGVIISISLFALLIFFISTGDFTIVSAKRFLGNGANPSERLGSTIYILFKVIQISEIAFYLSFFFYLIGSEKYNKIWLVFSLISLGIVVLNAILFSSRASLLILLIDIFLIYSIVKKKIDYKIIISAALFFALFMLITVLRHQAYGVEKSLLDSLFGGRYFADIAKQGVILESLNNFSYSLDYSSISNFITSYMNIGRFVGMEIFKHEELSGVPMGIMAEMYWIGGLGAVISFGVFLGLMYKIVFLLLTKSTIHMYMLLILVFIYSRSVVFLTNNGLGVTIYQIGTDVIVLTVFALITLKSKLELKYIMNFLPKLRP